MATNSYTRDAIASPAWVSAHEQEDESRLLEKVSTWLMMVPVLFITLSGWITTDTTPLAFRVTAMADESPGRKLTRLACTILIVVLVSTQFRAVLEVFKRSKLIFLFPALAFLSALWSQNSSHTIVSAFSLLVVTLFATYLYVKYPGDRLLSVLNLGAFIVLLLCVFSVTIMPSIGIDPYHENAWRGIFGQRNDCALNCTLFLTVGLYAPAFGIVQKLLRFSVVTLSAFFILMTNSRTGWILAILAVLLTYLLRFVSRLRSLDRFFFLLVMAVPTLVMGFFIFNNYTQILAAMDKDPTMTQRTVIWAATIPSILKHPLLGYGYMSFWQGLDGPSQYAVLVTGWMESQAQDGYLDVLLGLGLAGFIPLVLLFLRAGRHAAAAVEQKRLNAVTSWAIVFLPVLLIGNIGESSLVYPLNVSWFYALIAFLILARADRFAEGY